MSNFQENWEDEDFDTAEETSARDTGGDNLVRQLRKQQRESEKRAKALEAELAEFRKDRRISSIQTVLNERGLNPKVAELIPADIEANQDAVANWLNQYGELFGLPQQEDAQRPDLSTLRQIDKVTNSAQTPMGDDDMLLRISQAGSAEEIINMIYGQN